MSECELELELPSLARLLVLLGIFRWKISQTLPEQIFMHLSPLRDHLLSLDLYLKPSKAWKYLRSSAMPQNIVWLSIRNNLVRGILKL